MTWRHVLVVLVAVVLPGCAQPIEGTADLARCPPRESVC